MINQVIGYSSCFTMASLGIFFLSFILSFVKGLPLIQPQDQKQNQDQCDSGKIIIIPTTIILLPSVSESESSEKTLKQFESELTQYFNSTTVNVTLNLNHNINSSVRYPPTVKEFEISVFLVILKPKTLEKYETPQQQQQQQQKEGRVGISGWKNILGSSIGNIQNVFLNPLELISSERGGVEESGNGEIIKSWEMIPENLKNDTIELIKKFQQGKVIKYGMLFDPYSTSLEKLQNLVPSTSVLLRPSQQHESFAQKPATEVDKLTEYAEQFVEALNTITVQLPFDYLVQRFKDLNLTLDSLDFGARDKIHQKFLELTFGNPHEEEEEEENKKQEDYDIKKHSFITITGNGNSNGNGFSASSGRPSLPLSNSTIILPTPKPASVALLSPSSRPIFKPLSKPILALKPKPLHLHVPVTNKPKPVHLLVPVTNKPSSSNNINNNNNNYAPHQQQNNENTVASASAGASLSTGVDTYRPFPFTTTVPTPSNWHFEQDEISFFPDKHNNGNNNDDGSNSNSDGNQGSGGGIFNLNFNLLKFNFNFNFQYQPPTPPFLISPFAPKPSKRPVYNGNQDGLSNENGHYYYDT